MNIEKGTPVMLHCSVILFRMYMYVPAVSLVNVMSLTTWRSTSLVGSVVLSRQDVCVCLFGYLVCPLSAEGNFF